MRYHTKEYYELLMSVGESDLFEPVIDREYDDEAIEELYQWAMEKYIQESHIEYDTPPEMFFDDEDDEDEDDEDDADSGSFSIGGYVFDPEDYAVIMESYENRPPFDEEEAKEEFEEMYRDNLEEPDEDLPDWVREAVDPRILAMELMPEKIYRKLKAEDDENQAKLDALDEAADAALEAVRDELPEELDDLTELLEELEASFVLKWDDADGDITMVVQDWDDEGDELLHRLIFSDVEVLENEGIEVNCFEDEDGDHESDCELVYSEVYLEDGMPEIHMMFDNDGLKYLTFRCGAVQTDQARKVRL